MPSHGGDLFINVVESTSVIDYRHSDLPFVNRLHLVEGAAHSYNETVQVTAKRRRSCLGCTETPAAVRDHLFVPTRAVKNTSGPHSRRTIRAIRSSEYKAVNQ